MQSAVASSKHHDIKRTDALKIGPNGRHAQI